MSGNNDEDYEEWVDDAEPVFRSLSLGQASYDQQSVMGTFGGEGMMSASMQTYDADEEAPVYRSLAVAPALNPHNTFGGFGGMNIHSMEAHTIGHQKPALVNPHTKKYPPVTLSAVPISTSFLSQCHVYARANKDEIAFMVSQFLKDWGVDFTFKEKKGKWKCVHYDYGQHVDFRVRLYMSVDQTDAYPLEFQRRQGPVLQFNRMYQNLTYKLSQAGYLRDPVRQPTAPLPMPSLPPSAPQVIDEGVARLVEMAGSPLEDVKYQALISLSKLSHKDEYQASLLRQTKAIETFRCSFSGSPHVRRCGVTILADMCATSAGQIAVADGLDVTNGDHKMLQLLFSMVEGNVYSCELEMRRQSCRLLACLASICYTAIVTVAQSNESATQLLVSCASVEDARLRKHLEEIKDALRLNGIAI